MEQSTEQRKDQLKLIAGRPVGRVPGLSEHDRHELTPVNLWSSAMIHRLSTISPNIQCLWEGFFAINYQINTFAMQSEDLLNMLDLRAIYDFVFGFGGATIL